MDTSRAPFAGVRKKSPSVLTVSPDGTQDYTTVPLALAGSEVAAATTESPVLIDALPSVAHYMGTLPANVYISYVQDLTEPTIDRYLAVGFLDGTDYRITPFLSKDGATFSPFSTPLTPIATQSNFREPDCIPWTDADGSRCWLWLWDDYSDVHYYIGKSKTLLGPITLITTLDMTAFTGHSTNESPYWIFSPQFFVDSRDNSIHLIVHFQKSTVNGGALTPYHMEPNNPADMTTWTDNSGWTTPTRILIKAVGGGSDWSHEAFDFFPIRRAADGYYYGVFAATVSDVKYLYFAKSASTTDPFSNYTILNASNVFTPLVALEGCCIVDMGGGTYRCYFDIEQLQGSYHSDTTNFTTWSAPVATDFRIPAGVTSHTTVRKVRLGMHDVSDALLSASEAAKIPAAPKIVNVSASRDLTLADLGIGDSGCILIVDSGSTVTLQMPIWGSMPLPLGTRLTVLKVGAGQVGIAAGILDTIAGGSTAITNAAGSTYATLTLLVVKRDVGDGAQFWAVEKSSGTWAVT